MRGRYPGRDILAGPWHKHSHDNRTKNQDISSRHGDEFSVAIQKNTQHSRTHNKCDQRQRQTQQERTVLYIARCQPRANKSYQWLGGYPQYNRQQDAKASQEIEQAADKPAVIGSALPRPRINKHRNKAELGTLARHGVDETRQSQGYDKGIGRGACAEPGSH